MKLSSTTEGSFCLTFKKGQYAIKFKCKAICFNNVCAY